MIVPSDKLLRWVGWVGVPALGLAGLDPRWSPVALGVVAALCFLLILDALRAPEVLDGLAVETPGVIRLTRGSAGVIPLRFRESSDGRVPRGLRLGLALPAEVRSEWDDAAVEGAGDGRGGGVALRWPVRAECRGRWTVPACHVEADSARGFWKVRRRLPLVCEIRSYPALREERRRVAEFLTRGLAGMHQRRRMGQGREFEQLREYQAGDGFDEIHWKATARRGVPVTKVFQVERTQEVYAILDASRQSLRETPPAGLDGGRPLTVLDRSLAAALVLAAAAGRQGDHFGVMAFDREVRLFLRARGGMQHQGACREALYRLESAPASPDFEEVCTALRLRLRRRALLVFFASLDDPLVAEGFVRGIELLRRQHLVLVVMPQPPEVRPLFEESGVTDLASVYDALGAHLRWRRMRALERTLAQRGVVLALVKDEAMAYEAVARYAEVKQRQAL